MQTAIDLINEERQRQVTDENWQPYHDDRYIKGELSKAAYCYEVGNRKDRMWPWDAKYWKPKNRLKDLVRAGALLKADKERIDRRIEKIVYEIDNNLNYTK